MAHAKSVPLRGLAPTNPIAPYLACLPASAWAFVCLPGRGPPAVCPGPWVPCCDVHAQQHALNKAGCRSQTQREQSLFKGAPR